MNEGRSLDKRLRLYAQALNAQISGTAFANAEHTLEMRLARWLRMFHDRVDGDDLALTHEFLSMMLGVPRWRDNHDPCSRRQRVDPRHPGPAEDPGPRRSGETRRQRLWDARGRVGTSDGRGRPRWGARALHEIDDRSCVIRRGVLFD